MTTEQHINCTADNNRRSNFGKAVLAIASVKAKEMHGFFYFEFWCASHLLLPQRTKTIIHKFVTLC